MRNISTLLTILTISLLISVSLHAATSTKKFTDWKIEGVDKTIEAKLVSTLGHQVVLEQADGQLITVDKNRFSEEAQSLIAGQLLELESSVDQAARIEERQTSIGLSLIIGGVLGFCLVSFQTVMKGKSGLVPGLLIASLFITLFLFASLQEDGSEHEILPSKAQMDSIKVYFGLQDATSQNDVTKIIVKGDVNI